MIIRPQDATSYFVRAIKYNFCFPLCNIARTIKIFHTAFGAHVIF